MAFLAPGPKGFEQLLYLTSAQHCRQHPFVPVLSARHTCLALMPQINMSPAVLDLLTPSIASTAAANGPQMFFSPQSFTERKSQPLVYPLGWPDSPLWKVCATELVLPPALRPPVLFKCLLSSAYMHTGGGRLCPSRCRSQKSNSGHQTQLNSHL